MNLDRLESLIGSEALKEIKNTRILIVGIGGVGGYTFESLVRSGIENITIIDGDVIESSNLNRQITSKSNNIGERKVIEAKKRAIEINPNINVKDLFMFLDKDNISEINFNDYDYIVDACDTVSTKLLLISESIKNNIKIISSMGTAKKMHAKNLEITTLDKTSYDPLAKVIRKSVPKEIQRQVIVVSSKEEVINTDILGSNSFVPAVAGLLITDYIINDICNKK